MKKYIFILLGLTLSCAAQVEYSIYNTPERDEGTTRSLNYLDQSVKSNATPNFSGLYITNDIAVGGTVDGRDISADYTATQAALGDKLNVSNPDFDGTLTSGTPAGFNIAEISEDGIGIREDGYSGAYVDPFSLKVHDGASHLPPSTYSMLQWLGRSGYTFRGYDLHIRQVYAEVFGGGDGQVNYNDPVDLLFNDILNAGDVDMQTLDVAGQADVGGNIVPKTGTQSLGTLAAPWQDIYVQNNSLIYVGGDGSESRVGISDDGALVVSRTDTNGVPLSTNDFVEVGDSVTLYSEGGTISVSTQLVDKANVDALDTIVSNALAAANDTQDTAIGLNTTHRGSDGKDHSDVVLNNTHRSSDGSDHSLAVSAIQPADLTSTSNDLTAAFIANDTVVSNALVAANDTQDTAIGLNTTHRSSDGSDHTFIDQDVTSTATPTFGAVQYTPSAGSAHAEGKLYYDSDDDTFVMYNAESEVGLNVGEEMWIYVRNDSGATITNGTAVYVTGATGQKPTIALAKADADATAHVVAIATHNIENNSNGYVADFGIVRDFDTSSWLEGADLYLSATVAGGLTTNAPTGTDVTLKVAEVLYSHAVNGKILVNVGDHFHIADAWDVNDGTPTSGNFLIGDGTHWNSGTDGSSLVSLNASELDSGTVPDARIASNVVRANDSVTLYSEGGAPTVSTQYVDKAFVEAQVAAAGATNAIYGELYRNNQAGTTAVPNGSYAVIEGWTAADTEGVTLTTTSMVVQASGEYEFLATISGNTVANNKIVDYAFHKNGTLLPHTIVRRKFGTGGDVGAIAISGLDSLDIGDVITLRARGEGATATLTTRYGNWSLRRTVASSASTNWAQYAASTDINAGGNIITNYGTPTAADHVTDKGYVDTADALAMKKDGDSNLDMNLNDIQAAGDVNAQTATIGANVFAASTAAEFDTTGSATGDVYVADGAGGGAWMDTPSFVYNEIVMYGVQVDLPLFDYAAASGEAAQGTDDGDCVVVLSDTNNASLEVNRRLGQTELYIDTGDTNAWIKLKTQDGVGSWANWVSAGGSAYRDRIINPSGSYANVSVLAKFSYKGASVGSGKTGCIDFRMGPVNEEAVGDFSSGNGFGALFTNGYAQVYTYTNGVIQTQTSGTDIVSGDNQWGWVKLDYTENETTLTLFNRYGSKLGTSISTGDAAGTMEPPSWSVGIKGDSAGGNLWFRLHEAGVWLWK